MSVKQHEAIQTKTCYKCKRDLSISKFSKDKTTKDGHSYTCKDCVKDYRLNNIDKLKDYAKKYREEHREENMEYCREYHERIKQKALRKLRDPPECAHCFTDDVRILSIDHINNDGIEERKYVSPSKLRQKIIKMSEENAKKEYQLLCRNCNWIKHLDYKEGISHIS